MPLSVEDIGQSTDGNRLIAICYYGEQQGDLMRDPEMVFEIHTSASPDRASPCRPARSEPASQGIWKMRLVPISIAINRIVNLAPVDPFSLSLLERFPQGASCSFGSPLKKYEALPAITSCRIRQSNNIWCSSADIGPVRVSGAIPDYTQLVIGSLHWTRDERRYTSKRSDFRAAA